MTVRTMHLWSAIQTMSLQEQALAAPHAEEMGNARRSFASWAFGCQCRVADRRSWVAELALQK